MKPTLTLMIALACHATLHGQTAPAPESTVALGPALIQVKVLSQSWDQGQHCVEVVLHAPGVAAAVYNIERIYSESAGVPVRLSANGRLGTLPSRWRNEIESNVLEPPRDAPGLSGSTIKDCDRTGLTIRPSSFRVVVRGIEMEDGAAFGDADVLEDRRAVLREFRNTLDFLERTQREVASMPGRQGFVKFYEHLSANIVAVPESSFPTRGLLRDWMQGILVGHPELFDTPENFLPRLHTLIQQYRWETDRLLGP